MIPAFLFGIAAFYAFLYYPYTIALTAVPSLFVMLFKKRHALAVFFILGAAYAFILAPGTEPELKSGMITAVGRFVSAPVISESGVRQDFEASPDGTIRIVADRVFDTERLYTLRLQIIKPAERLNPGERYRNPYARLIGVISAETSESDKWGLAPLAFLNSIRFRLGGFMQRTFKAEQAAFLMALTIGERANIGEDLNRAFSVTGLAHILSISGTHFGLLFLLLFGALRSALRHIPIRALERITLHMTLSELAAVFSLPLMFLYLGISGASIPALRSFIMIVLYLVGLLAGRKGRGLHFLLLAALMLVLYEPEVLLNLSFELSFLAVLFINWWAGKEWPRDKIKEKSLLLYVRNAFYVSFAASFGVAPLVAYHFHYMSLISPVSNFIVTPVVGFLLLPLTLFGSFCYLLTGAFVVTPLVEWLSGFSLLLVRTFASVPGCSANIAQFPLSLILFFYSGLFIYGISGKAERNTEEGPLRKRYRMPKAAGLLIAFFPLLLFSSVKAISREPLSVTFLDAGHADALIIETPGRDKGGKKAIVVDTGRDGREAAAYLRARGIDSIEAIAITHSHEDHAGGLGYLLGRFYVKEVWDSGRLLYEPPLGATGGADPSFMHRRLKEGDVIEAAGLRLSVLHPSEDFQGGAGGASPENNESLVLRLEGKRTSFLFTGDIEEEAQEHLLRSGLRLKSDVLKVPHHGGATSAHEGFLGAVAPTVSVITSWRKPSERMSLALRGSLILSTRMEGAIKIEDGGAVKTYAEFKLRKTTDIKEEMKNLRRLFISW